MKPIKVIDLFAGPGGLGEGFANVSVGGESSFRIAVSIENNLSAHRTLTLRAFFRNFNNPPDEYYAFLKGELGKIPDDELYRIPKFKKEIEAAKNEALCLTLGKDDLAIKRAIDAAVGDDECVLIGGPPCQAYSVIGRSRNKGQSDYVPEKDDRNFLYQEYLKVIARYQPKAFVMENVKGLLSAKINKELIIEKVLSDLADPGSVTRIKPRSGYRKHKYTIFPLAPKAGAGDLFDDSLWGRKLDPRDYVIESEFFGIPQKRHRVILVGLRNDIVHNLSDFPSLVPHQRKVSVGEVIGTLPKLRSGLSKEKNTVENWLNLIRSQGSELVAKLREEGSKSLAETIDRQINSRIVAPRSGQGVNIGLKTTKSTQIPGKKDLEAWYYDKRLEGYITNHESRGHIAADLQRYLFCSAWGQAGERKNAPMGPKAKDFPDFLKPNHKNFDSGKFVDRFKVQLKDQPGSTVTSHISKDGHYYIHYDPLQCRSLTVREAARVQTFPDNYHFCGNRTEQYVQVGNAVPPFLAKQIASIIISVITDIKQ